MKICTIASSSSGNCTLVTGGGSCLLIDAGISMRRTVAAMKNAGVDPGSLSAVLVTHEHSDHISGLPMLAKHLRVPVYMSRGTAVGVRKAYPHSDIDIKEFNAGDGFEINGMMICSFATPHDTPESVGFRLTDGTASFVFATDTGYLSETLLAASKGADAAVIEANHDLNMLRYGMYPAYLKRRIMADTGHMSNKISGIFARELVKTGAKRIILGHLSKENNTPQLAYSAVSSALEDIGADVGNDVALTVAPRCEMSGIYTI